MRVRKTAGSRAGTATDGVNRIGHFDQLESRELLSAFQPVDVRFDWTGPGKRVPPTSVRYDAEGQFLGATGPEAGLHPGGLLGGSSRDPNQVRLTFNGKVNARTLTASDISVTGNLDPADPFRILRVKAKKGSVTLYTVGGFSNDAGADLTLQVNGVQGGKPAVWMDPWSVTLNINADAGCTTNCGTNSPPHVTGTTPSAGSTVNQAPTELIVQFNEDLVASSVTNPANFALIRSGGDGVFGNGNDSLITPSNVSYDSATDQARFSFSTPLANDDYRIRVFGTGASPIRDLDGAALDGDGNGVAGGDYVSLFHVAVSGSTGDTTPPRVTSVTPSAGSTLTNAPTSIDLTVNEDVRAGDVTSAGAVTLVAATDGIFGNGNDVAMTPTSVSYDSVNHRVHIDVSTLVFASGDSYQVSLSGSVRDLAGNSLDGNGDGVGGDPYRSTFQMSIPISDPIPPRVTGVTPLDGAVLTQTFAAIELSFSENLNSAGVNAANFTLIGAGGDHSFADGNELTIQPLRVEYDAARHVARIVLSGRLNNDDYRVRVSGAVRGQDGNQLDGNGDGVGGDPFTSTFSMEVPFAPDPQPGVQKDPTLGGDPPDPAGDTFPGSPVPKLDISSIAAFTGPQELYVNVRFSPSGPTILPPSGSGGTGDAEPNSVFGFIDIDTDQNLGSGFPVDRTPAPISGTPGLGVEYYVDIGSELKHPGKVDVLYTGRQIPLTGDTDFDGDDDLVLYRPDTGEFLIGENAAGSIGATFGPFAFAPKSLLGTVQLTPILGNWDPDGSGRVQARGPNQFGIFDATNGVFYLDLNGDHKLGEDIDGDGVLDPAEDLNNNGILDPGEDGNGNGLLDPAEDLNNNGVLDSESFFFGFSVPDPLDQVVVGDWDADGDDDIGVYRASTGQFLLDLNGNYIADDTPFTFGPSGSQFSDNVAVAGDWNFNGRTEVGVFVRGERDTNSDGILDPSEDFNGNRILDSTLGFWYLDRNGDRVFTPNEDTNGNNALDSGEDQNNNNLLDNEGPFVFGQSSDTPVIGGWVSPIRDDIGVFRTSTSQYFLDLNSDRAQSGAAEGPFTFGVPGDVPVTGVFAFDGRTRLGVYKNAALSGNQITGDQFLLDQDGNRQLTAGELPQRVAPRANVEFLSDSFTVKLPLSMLGGDDGFVNFGTTVGPFAGFTDEAPNPNSGVVASSGQVTPLQVESINFQNDQVFSITVPLAAGLPRSSITIPGTTVVGGANGTVGIEARLTGGDPSLTTLIDPRSVTKKTVMLIPAGGDDRFDGNEVPIVAHQIVVGSAFRTNDTIFVDLTGVQLGPDLYRFVIVGDDPVRDFTGVPLDGEFLDRTGDNVISNGDLPSGNGIAQGNFFATFRLDSPPEITSFRLTRPGDQNVDPPGTVPGDSGVIGDGTTNQTTPNFVGSVVDDRLTPTVDGIGDMFGTGGNQADILSASAEHNPVTNVLHVGLRFATDVALASANSPISVRGFIDIDADQNSATGGTGWLRDVNGNRLLDFSDGLVDLGREGDVPVVGNWTGSARSLLGVYRPSTGEFLLDLNGNGRLDNTENVISSGIANGTPLVADFNNDGRRDLAVFLDGQWVVDSNGDGVFQEPQFFYGSAGDIPVVGNWDGIGGFEIGIYTPATGTWQLDLNGNRLADDPTFVFGGPGQVPVVGDWNGDLHTKIGTYSATLSEWRLDLNGNRLLDSASEGPFVYGDIRSTPVVGDWNGDRHTDIGTFNTDPRITGSPAVARWIIDANGNRQFDPVDGPFAFGLGSEDRNGDGVLSSTEDTNSNGVIDAVDLPVVGAWDVTDPQRILSQIGVFRPRDGSHITAFGTGGRADLGVEYYIDLGSESGGTVDLIDARTSTIVQGVPIRIMPDSRTIIVDIPVSVLPEAPLGKITYGAIVGSTTQFVDQVPQQPRAAHSSESIQLDLAVGQSSDCRAGSDNIFDDGTAYTQGFGTFVFSVPGSQPLPETIPGCLPAVVKVRATDSAGNQATLSRSVRVDLKPPHLLGLVPPDNTQARQAPKTIVLQLNDDDLDPATAKRASSYRLLSANGTDQTDKIRTIDYNEIDDTITITLGEGLISGYYTFIVRGDSGGITDRAGNLFDGEPQGGGNPFPTGDGVAGGDFSSTFLLNFGPPRVTSITSGTGASLIRGVYDVTNEDVDGTGDPTQPDLNGNGQFDLGVAAAPPRSIVITFDQPLDPATINSSTVFLTRTRTRDQITGLVSQIGDGEFDGFSDRVTGTSVLSTDGLTLTFTPDPQYLDPDGDGVAEGLQPDYYRFTLVGGGVLRPQPSGQQNNVDVSCDDFRDDAGNPVITVVPAAACSTDNRDPSDPNGYQISPSIDMYVTNPLDPRSSNNLVMIGSEDRGKLFNPLDDRLAVYISDDSGTTWTKQSFFDSPAARTVNVQGNQVTFDVATHPSVTFDTLGTAYVSYLLMDLPNVGDFPGSDFVADATGPLEINDVSGMRDTANYYFEIGFSHSISPLAPGEKRGKIFIDSQTPPNPDGSFNPLFDGVADRVIDLDSEHFIPSSPNSTTGTRFVNLVDANTGSVVSDRVLIEYVGDRVRLRVARSLLDLDGDGRAIFRAEVTDPAGVLSDQSPNPGVTVPGTDGIAGFAPMFDLSFRSSAVVVSRALNVVAAPGGDAIFGATVPVAFNFHEDINYNNVLDANEVDVNGDGQLTLSRFVNESPSIAVDKTLRLPDSRGTPNSNADFVYVSFVEAGVADSLTNRSVFVAKSSNAVTYNATSLNPGNPVANQTFSFNSLNQNFQLSQAFRTSRVDDPTFAGGTSRRGTPRVATGPYGQVYVIWEDYAQDDLSRIFFDRSYDSFQANVTSDFPDTTRDDTPFLPPTGNPAGTLPPPPNPQGPIVFRGSNWAGRDIQVAQTPVNGSRDSESTDLNTQYDAQAPVALCDGPDFPDFVNGPTFRDCYSIEAQPSRGIRADASMAVDLSPGLFRGRIYVAYVAQGDPANPLGHDDTDIFVTFSDDDGLNWSTYQLAFPFGSPQLVPPGAQVNDDGDNGSQFNPSISVDPVTGNVYLAWYDTRNDLPDFVRGVTGNRESELFFAVGRPETAGIAFLQNQVVTTRPSDQSLSNPARSKFGLGDTTGIVGVDGIVHPAWADTRLLLVDNTTTPQVEHQIGEIFSASIDVQPSFEAPTQTSAITDVLGNPLDGEALNVTESQVGLPSGDGTAGGNFVAGFLISDHFLFADSGFEEDPLHPSDGASSNPFPTMQRAVDQANSIVFTATFSNSIALPSTVLPAGDPRAGRRVHGFVNMDVDENAATGKVNNGSAIYPITLEPSDIGVDFYLDLSSEFRHPGVVEIINTTTRRSVGFAPISLGGDPASPTSLVVEVPRNLIKIGEFIPDRVQFSTIVGTDTNNNGRLDAAEVSDAAPAGTLPNREHYLLSDAVGDGGSLDLTHIVADFSPVVPAVVIVRNGERPGSQPVPYVVQPPPGGLNGTLIVGDFTTVEFEPGTVVKLRASNLDFAGIGSNVISKGTKERPVIFTSLFNDTELGDTNGDGSNTTPGKGNWGGLVLRDGSDDTLSFVNFTRLEFGGGVVPRGGTGGLDTDIRPEPITLKGARPTVVNSIIENSGDFVAGLVSNAQAAMSATPSSFIDDTAEPADGTAAGQRGPLFRNLEFRDNSINGLLIQASHDTGESALNRFSVARWDDTEVTHVLTSVLRVTSGSSLTIDPGIIVKSNHGAIQVDARSTLRVGADGHNDARVVFTSIYDDSTGEDTNGDGFAGTTAGATPPAPGDWGSIFAAPPPVRLNLAVAEGGLEQRVYSGGPTVIIDEADIRFAGGLYVDNLVPSLGLGVLVSTPSPGAVLYTGAQCLTTPTNCRPRSPVQLETAGYYQITSTRFINNGLAANGVSDPPLAVFARVLRPDVPNDLPGTIEDESALNENPLIYGNEFINNELNGMEVIPIDSMFQPDPFFETSSLAPASAHLLNTQFVDMDGDGRLELSDGIDGYWDDTTVVHILRDTLSMPGRVEVPNVLNFGVLDVRNPNEFRDRLLKAGRVDRSNIREIDFETDPFGAPLSNNQVIDPELFNASPYDISIQPLAGTLAPQIQGLLTPQGNWSTGLPPGCPIIGPEPLHVPTSGSNSLGGLGTDNTADAFRLVMHQDVFAFGLNIIQSDFTANETIDVLVRDPSGVVANHSIPFPLGSGFIGFISAFPIVEIRLNEARNSEQFCTGVLDLDDVSYDDFVFSTSPVYPFVPTATQPSAVLTITSVPEGTTLKSPDNKPLIVTENSEGVVVKMSGAAPAVNLTGADAFNGTAGLNRAFVGAGFQVGMDDGIDQLGKTIPVPPPYSNPTLDWGLGSAIRILGIGGVEATGQNRVPVVLTSLEDDREGPGGLPQDTNNDGLIPLTGTLTGIGSAPSSGDWGDIFIGARSAGDRDDLWVPNALGQLVQNGQAVPGRAFSDRNASILPELDETQGSVIMDARIKYGAKIREQGASQISYTANPLAFGQQALHGTVTLPPGATDPIVCFSGGCTAENGSIIFSQNEIFNMRDAGLIAHPGFFRFADGTHDDFVWVPAEPMVFNNVIAFVNQLNGNARGATDGQYGVRIQGADPGEPLHENIFDGSSAVVMNNTIFGTIVGVELGPDADALAINNVISNITGGGNSGLLLTPNDLGILNSQAGFNLFFNANGQGLNNINGNAVFTAPSLFLNAANGDFRLLRFSPTGQANPAIDSAIGEFAPSSAWASAIDDTIVRLPLPQTVFNTSPLGPEKDLFGNVRQDDVLIPNAPPRIGVGGEVFFDMGALESRDLGAPIIVNGIFDLSGPDVRLTPFGPSFQEPQISEFPDSIDITFSEDIDPGTINAQSVQLVPSENGIFEGTEQPINTLLDFDPSTNVLTITPTTRLNEDRYRLTIKGVGQFAITDLDGVRLDGEFPGSQSNTSVTTGYPSGNGIPGGNFVSFFRIGIPPRVTSVTVIDSRSSPPEQLGPTRGVDADFFPDETQFQVDNPPTSILIEFSKDVVLNSSSAFTVSAMGPDGQFGTADDIPIPGSIIPAAGSLTRSVEFRPQVQGALPTDTIYRVSLNASLITDQSGIILDGEFISGNEDSNRNGLLDPGEDRNGNGQLDVGADQMPSGDGNAGGDFRGHFQVGEIGVNTTTEAIIVDGTFAATPGACPLDGAGQPREVGTAACPYNTIQEAIDAAAVSTTSKVVEVLAGTYYENVRFEARHAGVTLRSRNGDRDTVIEVAPGRANADGVPVSTLLPALSFTAVGDVSVDGFRITTDRGTGVRFDMGGATATSKSAVLRNSTVFANTTGVLAVLGTGSAPQLENNVIWANSGYGIEVRGKAGDSEAQIVNNSIVFNRDGIRLLDTGVGVPEIANIFNNIIVGSDRAGIRSENTAGATIDFNDVFQNLAGNYINVQQIGLHNISADPLFRAPVQRPVTGKPDPTLANYQLGSFSPAIDIGLGNEDLNGNGSLDVGEDQNGNGKLDAPPVRDHDNNLRFDDVPTGVFGGFGTPGYVDMGAFERQTPSSGAPGSARTGGGGSGGGGSSIDAVLAERFSPATVDILDHSALQGSGDRKTDENLVDMILSVRNTLSHKHLGKAARTHK